MPRDVRRVVLPEGSSVLQAFLDAQRDGLEDRRVILPTGPLPTEPVVGEVHFDGEAMWVYTRSGQWGQVFPAIVAIEDSVPPWVREHWKLAESLYQATDIPESEQKDYGGV